MVEIAQVFSKLVEYSQSLLPWAAVIGMMALGGLIILKKNPNEV